MPPYSFAHPVREAARSASAVAALAAAVLVGKNVSAANSAQLARPQQIVTQLEDERAIEYLHNAYGYYLDRWQWDDVADLFAEDGTIEFAQRGVYVGKAQVRQSLALFGTQGLHQQELFDHLQYQPVVHVAADGRSAKARVRELGMEGKFGVDAQITGGVYENEYVKEGGVWKIKTLHLYTTFVADLENDWSKGPRPAPGADATLRPDRPPSVRYQSFPIYNMAPFHYPHPVTGLPIAD